MVKNEWYQGIFSPTNLSKCINKTAIQYRSSWECRFCHWLDVNPSVIKWGYEVITIPYRSDIDGKIHKYIVDFYAEIKDKSNQINKYLIEIKPKKQSIKPIPPKHKTVKSMKNYIYESYQFIKNQNKWQAAQKFCQQNGMIFKLLDKETLF